MRLVHFMLDFIDFESWLGLLHHKRNLCTSVQILILADLSGKAHDTEEVTGLEDLRR